MMIIELNSQNRLIIVTYNIKSRFMNEKMMIMIIHNINNRLNRMNVMIFKLNNLKLDQIFRIMTHNYRK